jgi:peptidoglycan/xylan/chitin deacetylase (PgdA/CDA1 family)
MGFQQPHARHHTGDDGGEVTLFRPMRWFASACICALAFAHAASAAQVAITFDDLPLNGTLAPGTTRAGLVAEVLAILKQRELPPVYGFVNAQKLEGSEDAAQALRQWVAGGERVGNHSYSHPDLHKSSPEIFLADVRRNEPVLELLDASDAWRWFRYPYLREGDTLDKRRTVRAALHDAGYRIAQVTLDYEDYLWNTPYARCAAKHDAQAIAWLRTSYLETAKNYLSADREMATRVFGHDIPHVLLLHLGAYSPTILPDLLDLLHAEGYTFATLEQVQSDPAYSSDPDAPSKWGGTLLEQWMDARHLTYPDVAKKPYKALEAICAAP